MASESSSADNIIHSLEPRHPSESSYPPEPWYLGGTLLVSSFLVPIAQLPPSFAAALPPRRSPVTIGDRAIVGVGFANYSHGGVLHYDELLVAVPSLRAGRLRYTIPQIWVDSAASRQGARELWAIPKQLATFDRTVSPSGVLTTMTLDDPTATLPGDRSVATLTARFGRARVPGMRQLALPIVQAEPGRRVLSHNLVIGRMTTLSATWTFSPDGPLAYLAGLKPFASFAVRDAAVVFGMGVRRSRPGIQALPK
jgi:hypothetical protein